MSREIQHPTVDERGDEHHPAWAMIGASRVSHSPPGATLFDSDIQHQHYVVVKVSTASRRRDLNRDWLHADKEFLEIAMSEAQWASFVSSMNVGSGVPATILREDWRDVPGMPYEPRLRESMTEVRDAGEKVVAQIREAFKKYQEHKTKGNLQHLEAMIDNAPSNMTFAAKSLSEHAENVVQRARADIEAFVVDKANQLGIEPGELGVTPQLTAGDDE